jgi:hypothetical protein
MARGKKTSPEVIYQVMTSWCVTQNNNQTARELGIPESTVRKIVEDNKDKEEFKKLCEQKRDEFADRATVVIDMAINRLVDQLADEDRDIPTHHLSTVIGTMFDKRALARGEMTQNLGFATNFDVNKLAEIAGYTKKDDE